MATFTAVAGTLFKYTVSSTLTTIPGVQSMSFSGGEKNDIEVTAISDEDQVFVGGRRSALELSFGMYWDPTDAGQVAMLTAYSASSSTPVAMTITEADAGAASQAFSGYVKSMVPAYDRDNAHMYNVVIKLTTAITFTA